MLQKRNDEYERITTEGRVNKNLECATIWMMLEEVMCIAQARLSYKVYHQILYLHYIYRTLNSRQLGLSGLN